MASTSHHVKPALRRLVAPGLAAIALLGGLAAASAQQRPPRGLLKQVAANGSLFEQELGRYTYRQTFRFMELDKRGKPGGDYLEVRDVTLKPDGSRDEEFLKGPINRLERIRMTEEDFRDLRDMQPFVLTEETLWLYQTRYKGEEMLGDLNCFVYRIEPRQVLEGQRFLDGQIWVDQQSLQVVQVGGQPVPQLYRNDEQANLFARFVTIYDSVDGKFWFPQKTVANDALAFPSGVQRVRYEVDYENYQRFSVDSSIQFGRTGDEQP